VLANDFSKYNQDPWKASVFSLLGMERFQSMEEWSVLKLLIERK